MRALWLQSDPDLNPLFRRRWTEPPWPKRKCQLAHNRTRGPGGGRSVIGENVVGDEAKDTAVRRLAQWVAAEIELFGRVGRVGGL